MILKEIPTKNGMSPWSKIEFKCDECSCEYIRINSSYLKMKENPLYTKDYCKRCWQSLRNKQPEYRLKMSESLKEMRKNNPYLAKRISKTSKARKINAGDKNAMKRKDVRKRMSETRKKRIKEDPELRKLIAQNTANAWAAGKYDGVKVGRCKWYTYTHTQMGQNTKYKGNGNWLLLNG